MRWRVQKAMWGYPTIFGNFSLARVLGDGVRSQYTLTEPLPEQWLELIAKLEGPPEAPTLSSQPKQCEDGDGF
jgi:hypothetical protein